MSDIPDFKNLFTLEGKIAIVTGGKIRSNGRGRVIKRSQLIYFQALEVLDYMQRQLSSSKEPNLSL
jgi:hypothetical protein